MKKLILLITLILCITSCTSWRFNDANFNFNLEVKGNIENFDTPIVSNFSVNVMNDVINIYDSDTVYTFESPEAYDVSKWLNRKVKKYLRKLKSNTLYEISALGYVEEKTTGIKVAIDKTWTNK